MATNGMASDPVGQLIAAMQSGSADERSDAAGSLRLLLEMNTIGRENREQYRELLPPDLLSMTLDQAAHARIVAALCRAVRSSHEKASTLNEKATMLRAFGPALPSVSAIPFLHLIRDDSFNWNALEAFQALLSLDDMLYGLKEGAAPCPIFLALVEADPTPFVQRAASMSDSDVSELAGHLLKRLDGILRRQ